MSPASDPKPISVQLYSLRDAASVDFEGVLRRLGRTGFAGVELAGLNGLSTDQFNAIKAEAGFRVSSAHIGDATSDALNASLDQLQSVGCDTAILSHLLPAAFESLDAVARSAELINAASSIAASRGMRFGYHNHWWEFQTQLDGRTAWDHLWSQLEPTVLAELDVYWTTYGGSDPTAVCAALGERVRYVHVKDGPADDSASPMVAVGSGSLDIAAIIGGAPHAEWHVVELDRCATDMADAVDASYAYLVGSGFSVGQK